MTVVRSCSREKASQWLILYLGLFSSWHVMAGYLRLEAMVAVFLFIMIWLWVKYCKTKI